MMKYFKELNLYVLPLIATNLLQIIIGQFSLAIATNSSKEILSAISIIQNFLFAFGGILGAFSLAFNILGARAATENSGQKLKNLIKSSFVLDLIIGIGFLLFSVIFGRFILNLIYGFKGELLNTATLYLTVMSPYIFLTLLMFLFSNLLKIERKTRHIFLINTASGIIELLLCYILVPKFGVIGAGASTIFSLLFIVLIYFLDSKKLTLDSLKELSNLKVKILNLGFPLAVQELFESVIFIVAFDALMSRLGLKILSVYAIIIQIFSIIRLPAYMYGGAVAIFLPEVIKNKNIKLFMKNIISYSMVFYLVLSVVGVSFSGIFVNLFIHHHNSFYLHPFLEITIFTMLFFPIYEICKTFLQSTDEEKFVVNRTIIVNLVSVIILVLLQLIHKQSYTSLFVVYGANICILSIIFFNKIKRKKYAYN